MFDCKYLLLITFLFISLCISSETCSVQFVDGSWRNCKLLDMNESFIVVEEGYNTPPRKYYADKLSRLIMVSNNMNYKVINGKIVVDDEVNNMLETALQGVTKIYIPNEFSIKDKIILVNHSQYLVQKAVIVDILEPNVALGSCFNVASNEEAIMADIPNNGLSGYVGHTLGLKVKGIRGEGDMVEVEYTFTASVQAKHHDLYITIYKDIEKSGDVLDF